jgi:hypothetical protein
VQRLAKIVGEKGKALDLDEATALEGVASGDPLSRVCAAFTGRGDAAAAAFDAIRSWFDEGWIAAAERSAGRSVEEA